MSVVRHLPEGEALDLQLRLDRLEKERDRLFGVLASMGDAVICTDETRAITFMNARAEALSGWSFQDATQQPIESVVALRQDDGALLRDDPLMRCIRTAMSQVSEKGYCLKTRTGDLRPIGFSIALIKSATGDQHGLVVIINDVSEVRAEEARLAHLATHDVLTGLPNRAYFLTALDELLTHARDKASSHVLCLIDLDRFKAVNDQGGHVAGDAVLIEVAQILRDKSPDSHIVARLGGDEFALLMTDCNEAKAEWFASRLIREIRNCRVVVQGKAYHVGASIGGTLIDGSQTGTSDLLHQADIACYLSKQRGRNRFSMHRPEDSAWLSEAAVKSAS
ncbi:MAG: diguanylate cyclase [Hyphomicrobiales bacterium]